MMRLITTRKQRTMQTELGIHRVLYLLLASESYMHGKITMEELEQVEQHYSSDIKRMILKLSERRIQQRFLHTIRCLGLFFVERSSISLL